MRTLVSLAGIVLATLLLGSSASTASAQRPRARALFEEGVQATQDERWADALELFRRSFALEERPGTLFNVGSSYFRLERFVDARASLDHYLELVGGAAREQQRVAQAREMRDECVRRIAHLRVTLVPPTGELRLDGEIVPAAGGTLELELDPGEHVLAASADGFASRDHRVSLLAGQTAAVRLELGARDAVLIVRASETSARIELDSEEVGTGEVELSRPAGTYHLRVGADGFRTHEQEVALVAGDRSVVEAVLSRNAGVETEWWFWTILGVVVVGGGVAVGVGVATYDPGVAPPTLGNFPEAGFIGIPPERP